MVTVAVFDNMVDAHIAMGRLQAEGVTCGLADEHLVQTDWLYSIAEGVPCGLADEHLVQTDWLYSIAVGGIKLQVDDEFEHQAREILATDYSDDVRGGEE